MDSYQEVYYSRRNRTRKTNKRLTAIIVLFFILIAFLIYFNSSFSKITMIQITGLNLLQEKDIYDKAGLDNNMQYFLTGVSNIENSLLELLEVKEVEVTKTFPGKLFIRIEENNPIAFIYRNDKFTLLLENGYIYHKDITKKYLDIPYITKWTDDTGIKDLANELTETDPSVLYQISEIQQNPQTLYPNQLLLITKEGYKVHINLDELSDRLELYPLIVESLKSKSTKLGDIYMVESIRFKEFSAKN